MTKYERARVLGARALQIRFALLSPSHPRPTACLLCQLQTPFALHPQPPAVQPCCLASCPTRCVRHLLHALCRSHSFFILPTPLPPATSPRRLQYECPHPSGAGGRDGSPAHCPEGTEVYLPMPRQCPCPASAHALPVPKPCLCLRKLSRWR